MPSTATPVSLAALAALFAFVPFADLRAQERPIVMIDPGHGGADAGVIEGDLVEKDLVLRIAFAIGAELVREGLDMRLTRSGDEGLDWDERRGRAEEVGAALLVMLHLNADDDPSRHGAEVYANLDDPASAEAARAVGNALAETGSEVIVEARPWPFLRSPTVPTVMVELAFLTHPVERRLIASDEFHREVGRAIARAARRLIGPEGG